MCNIFKKIKDTFLNPKFLKFSLCGVINTFNTAWISSLLHILHFQENLAAAIAFLLAISFGYILNSKFIFDFPLSHHGYFMYLITYVPHFLIYFCVTFITINTIGMPQFWGTVVATMICGPITFLIMKCFTFNNKFNKDSKDKKRKS